MATIFETTACVKQILGGLRPSIKNQAQPQRLGFSTNSAESFNLTLQ
jgi:hypothetical protein